MIKAIIFDWGDTLAPLTLDRYFPVERVKRRFKLDEKTVRECLEMLEKAETPFTPQTIEQEKEVLAKFWFQVTKKVNIKNPDFFVNYLLKWAFEKYTPSLFPEVLKTIQYLFKEKYHLAVLSNGWPKRFLEIKRSKVGKYFKKILVSAIIGAAKPEIEAYQRAIKEMGIPASEILFVDNEELYLFPAKNLGMKVVLMDRRNLYSDSKFSRIKDIAEIVNLI